MVRFPAQEHMSAKSEWTRNVSPSEPVRILDPVRQANEELLKSRSDRSRKL